jgi:phosphopentomutase
MICIACAKRQEKSWTGRTGWLAFIGVPGSFQRTGNRRDFAFPPPQKTLLDLLQDNGRAAVGIGKITSIFDSRGITEHMEAHSNSESIDQTLRALQAAPAGLIFVNLVDFDMLWGHRRDSKGFAAGLEYFDLRLPEIQGAMRDDDCLMVTADHGCDATFHGSDHTREYVPILVFGKQLSGGVDLGVRTTLSDMGQTIANNFDLSLSAGVSFLNDLR